MSEARPLVTVDGVLQDYLDQLLITATMTAADEVVPRVAIAEPLVKPVVVEAAIQPDAPVIKVVPPVAKIESPVVLTPVIPVITKADAKVPPVVVTPISIVKDIASSQQEDVTESLEIEMPKLATSTLNWKASQGIECLIFKVAGLKLAIPLPLLGGVYNVTDKVTPLFGQAAWSLGIWQGEDEKLTIIDSAELIMPERGMKLRDTGYSFFIQLDRSPWALACQEICDTVTLKEESIKWRGDASKRPWLAGTVIEEMCALLDVPGVMQLLDGQRMTAKSALRR